MFGILPVQPTCKRNATQGTANKAINLGKFPCGRAEQDPETSSGRGALEGGTPREIEEFSEKELETSAEQG